MCPLCGIRAMESVCDECQADLMAYQAVRAVRRLFAGMVPVVALALVWVF